MTASRRRRIWRRLLLAYVIAGSTCGVLAMASAIDLAMHPRPSARDSEMRESVHGLTVAVQSWAVDHHGRYPADGAVNARDLAEYTDWPRNPWTNEPMHQGDDEGDFQYATTGAEFEIVGFGGGGKEVIRVP